MNPRVTPRTESAPYVLRVTFGDQYRRDAHPRVDFAHPDGWFEVVLDRPPLDPRDAREEAVLEAQKVLGGAYAFDYSPESWEETEPERRAMFYPLGVLARLAVHADGTTSFDTFRRFRPAVREVTP